MKKLLSSVFLLFTLSLLSAQVTYEDITSVKLNTHRKLKIKLPKDYDSQSDLKHPVIIVFDGDYLFEPVIGQVDFQTYFDDMPGSIVVGVVQGKDRFYDGYVDEVSGLPTESGLRFHEFVIKELLPYLDSNYKTSKFRVAVGHNLMGNFINSFLFQEAQAFQAYVAISPDFKGAVESELPQRLDYLQNDVFYYMATADEDVNYIKRSVLDVHASLSELENPHLTYYFDNFKEETHYTLVTGAIARAFDKIFDIYKPIREKEINEKLIPYDGTLDKYLIERYKKIGYLFGIDKPITEEELEKVVKVADQRDDLESLQKLGKLTQKLYPDSPQGLYYLATHADRVGKKKKAAKLYQAALGMGESAVIDKELLMSMVEATSVATDDIEKEEEEDHEEN